MERMTMTVTKCCEAFRANREPMSPNKFWNNVQRGEYEGWVIPREGTKKRQATIYVTGFIEYMHRRGYEVVRPFETLTGPNAKRPAGAGTPTSQPG